MTDFRICNNIFVNFNSHKLSKDSEIFKLFYNRDLSGFKLVKISEIYNNLDENKQLFFLDEQGNEVEIKSIKKENYKGRIYDITVPHHIILVRRDELVVWSLNSCNNFTSLVYGSHTFKVYFKIKEEKMKVKTDSAKSETGDYPIVWLFIQVLHPAFTSFKRNETIQIFQLK